MSTLINDIKYAFRQLRKSPGFTVIIVLTLALGIGANSAVFSVFDRVILQLLPVQNPRELVLIEVDGQEAPGMAMSDSHQTVHSYPQYTDFRNHTEVFSGVIARTYLKAVFTQGDLGDRIDIEMVSGNFFQVLGIQAECGRLFNNLDDRIEGANPVAVISHSFWHRCFGGSPNVIGQTVTLNGKPMEVIGVVPEKFRGLLSGKPPQVYVPLSMRKQIRPAVDAITHVPERMVRSLNILVRLKSGITLKQASASTQGLWKGIQKDELEQLGSMIENKQEFLRRKIKLTPALQGIHTLRERIERPLLCIMALVVLVLLIACVNVAGLLMTRAISRKQEIAVRAALGASRIRLIQQVLMESLILGLSGAFAGLAVAIVTIKLLNISVLVEKLNSRILCFNFSLAILTSLIFSLAPAWQAVRTQLTTALKDRTSGSGSSNRNSLIRRSMVVVQVSLSMLLLVSAGLFVMTLYNLQNFDPGFRTDNLLSFSLDPALNGYNYEQGHLLYEKILNQLRLMPKVRSVGAAALPVFGNAGMTTSVTIEGYRANEGEEVNTSRNIISAGYFNTLGIPVILGREFNEFDHSGSPKVAIVNEAFVNRYFQGENPLGRKISFGDRNTPLDIEIVGIVKNQKNASLREETKYFVYTPYTHEEYNLPPLTFYLWSQRDEAALGPEVRRVIRGIDSNLPLFRMQTVRRRRDEVLELERMVALLSSVFAGIATTLATVGLYGLLAYSVAQRTREIGIRIALGAQRAQVFKLVFKEAIICFGAGLIIGIVLTLGFGRFLESQLFGLKAADPAVTIAAIIFLGLAALVAVLVPACRAARTDPMQALRYE
jgi:predicted permease